MTAKYELTKLYRRKAEILVTDSSLESFLDGKRDTLDHIVVVGHQEVIVTAKPQILDYQNYKPQKYA